MADQFRTILSRTESLFKDRGSKFIGYAIPISTTDEVKTLLHEIRALHPSARHVCYAYIEGSNSENQRANDDGEPNGSAGLPILNQIKSKEVTNVLVAVVRYFGGTKLGVSGLINAYKEAAKEALEMADTITTVQMNTINIRFPHSSIGDVERVIRQNAFEIADQQFGLDCKWTIRCAKTESQQCSDLLLSIKDVQLF